VLKVNKQVKHINVKITVPWPVTVKFQKMRNFDFYRDTNSKFHSLHFSDHPRYNAVSVCVHVSPVS